MSASAAGCSGSIYNLFMKKGAATDRKDAVPGPTEPPDVVPVPPLLPLQRDFRRAVMEATGGSRRIACRRRVGGGLCQGIE